jgi:tape measure domain-containing protein
MKFDNAQFERGIQSTLKALEALNKGLKLEGAAKGLTDVSAASKNVNLGHISSAVDSIASKFKAMSVIALTALTNIANRAVDAGLRLVKSLTVEPVIAGLREYETNLNSIQTILSNTQWQNTGLKDVNRALDELNEYSDKTIYNFSEMARNIGTFTAAGVKLEVATEAIKGIANLAAISGSNSQQASTAMYQLSQALATGKVALQDWNSVVNAGMGGRVFQEALMETARIHGVAIDEMVKDAGSFRNTLQEGWLTGEILTETLSKFTGDLTAAQLKTMGYNQQQIAQILKMGKTAQDAATKVKTMSQLISTLQEAAGSGWAKTWQLIFGDFEEARDMFTNVSNFLGGFISASADARNKVLGDWKELGGRTVLIEAIGNAFKALIAVVKPIRDAFRQIFPATTGKQLYDLTVNLRNFTQRLMIGSQTAENLRRTFAGVFAVLGIGWDILKAGISLFFRLFGVVTEGSGGILEFTGNIGDFLVGIRKAIQEGNLITNVFDKIGDALEFVIRLVKQAAAFIGGLFDGFEGSKAADRVTEYAKKLEPLGRLGDLAANVWARVVGILDNVAAAFAPIASKFSSFFDEVKDAFSGLSLGGGLNLQSILAVLGTGAFASLFLSLRGLVGNVSEIFDGLTGSMKTMQNTLRAATLLQIAGAIGVLTLSVVALSKIDTGGLTRALTAITVMFGQLFGMMLLFEKLAGFKGLLTMPLVAANMIILGVALRVLASSVKALSELDWDGLAKGLIGVTALMGIMIATAKLMPNPAGMISTGAGLLVMAAGIKVLASAVEDLSGHSWGELAKGLVGVGALLGALGLFVKFAGVNKGGLAQGAGLILLAVAIKILASAVEEFTGFKWEEIGRGLVAMAGSLAIVAAALLLIPPTAPLAAAGVLIVALSLGRVADALGQMAELSWGEIGRGLTAMLGALTIISAALFVIPPTAAFGAAGILITAVALLKVADVLDQMAAMSWGEIGKAMTVLAGSLILIAAAVTVMTGALSGAAAMLVVAASLAILAPILLLFSKMSWEEIAKGLLMLAGVFVVLGAAGLVLGALVPVLIGLGVAITLLGVGVLAAGAGVFLFAAALTALAVAGTAGTVALVAIVSAMLGLLPEVAKQIGLAVISFAETISKAGPAITKAIVTVLTALMDAILKLAPKIQQTLAILLMKMLQTIEKHIQPMTESGLRILIGFLNGVANNIGRVVTAATNLVNKFLAGISQNIPSVIQSGVNLVIKFVNSLANAIRSNSGAMRAAGRNLATAIIDGMTGGLLSGVGRVASAAKNAAKSALNAAMSVLGIRSPSKEFEWIGEMSDKGLANGLTKYTKIVKKSAANVGDSALNSMKMSLSKMPSILDNDIDTTPMIRPVLDLTDIRKDAGQISKLLATRPLVAAVSYSKAADVSATTRPATSQDDDQDDSPVSARSVSFTQNNYSPKALSSAQIYRQTKNQLSKAKGALTP